MLPLGLSTVWSEAVSGVMGELSSRPSVSIGSTSVDSTDQGLKIYF